MSMVEDIHRSQGIHGSLARVWYYCSEGRNMKEKKKTEKREEEAQVHVRKREGRMEIVRRRKKM
jgi:hypothetical protein